MATIETEFELDVSWWPYELHPETPAAGAELGDVVSGSPLTRQYRDHLKEYAASAGIELASRDRISNSHRALELSEFAKDHGRFEEIHNRLFVAYFEEGLDIGDEGVLEGIAGEAGLDLDAWRFETALGRYGSLIDQSTALARQKGFTSTPTMILDNRFMIPGAQDELVYRDVLKRMGASPRDGESHNAG